MMRVKQVIRKMLVGLPGGEAFLRYRAKLDHRHLTEHFPKDNDAKTVFLHHYEKNEWGNDESVSGDGSTLEYTANIRNVIPQLVAEIGIKTVLDAPCGDYNWFGKIEWKTPISYIGGDIVEPLIESHQSRFANDTTTFINLDIIKNKLPKADLWLCRDCLFHLPEQEIFLVFNNFLKSDIKYILTTTYPRCDMNYDIPIGSFRKINLKLPPYKLGEPIRLIDDWVEGYPMRQLALWDKDSVKKALKSNKAYQRALKRRS